MVAAKIEAPPSARSSRSTEVTTAWRSPIRATASPTRRGSSASTSPPRRPLFTAQKAQARVQVSPRIMKVAVPEFQHSPTLGQRASSQTVTSRFSRISDESWVTPCPTGARTVSQGGRRSTPSGRSRCQVGRESTCGVDEFGAPTGTSGICFMTSCHSTRRSGRSPAPARRRGEAPPRRTMGPDGTRPDIPRANAAQSSVMATVETPVNEPVQSYAPGTPERQRLQRALAEIETSAPLDLPMHIGGQTVEGTGGSLPVHAPHRHAQELGRAGQATVPAVEAAVDAALEASRDWAHTTLEERAAVFLRAADLLSGPWRDRMNAATILGQSKSVYQAEIDAACELIDFWRFNVHFAFKLREEQPVSSKGVWNRTELRPLEGYVVAITPFNFTSICREPPDGASPDGQHGGLEAVGDLDARRQHHHGAARGGGPAPRGHQHGDRPRRGRPRRRHLPPEPGRDPFHRLHRDLPGTLAPGGRQPRHLPHLPAAGRRDRRQGLRHRPRERLPGGAAGRAAARRLRVPGPEVLGSLPRLHPPAPLGGAARAARPRDRGDPDGGPHRLLELHGRGHRRARLPQARGRTAATPLGTPTST